MNYTKSHGVRDKSLTTYYGRITAIAGNRLVTKSLVSGERRYTIAADVKVTRDGRPCRFEDLKLDNDVRVYVRRDDDRMALAIAGFGRE
jgi:hypothetical protein